MYLGIDFWTNFELLPPEMSINELSSDAHVLSDIQQSKLQSVIKQFPSFAVLGLGKTSILSHSIDVGDAKPVKQRHFPVSPAVEKLLYEEVNRMIQLGVIEESDSPCKFCMKCVKYFGHIVGEGIVRTDPEKISAMTDFPLPRSLKALRRFLGMVGWYRKFISNFAAVSAPLTDLLKPRQKFVMTPEGEEAFTKLKEMLCSAPVLRSPDFSKPFYIHCDASNSGVGGVLVQKAESGE
ncbi:hypothetical protein KR200_005277, partial [Drosophila serrata]